MATMLACVQLAGIKQIITSRTFLERTKLKIKLLVESGIQLIYLEEVRARVSWAQKFVNRTRLTKARQACKLSARETPCRRTLGFDLVFDRDGLAEYKSAHA